MKIKSNEWSLRNRALRMDHLSEAKAWELLLRDDAALGTEILFRNVVMARRGPGASHRELADGEVYHTAV